jgi:alkylation response protein AidB-like acyl-CoA dehydrogenase
MVQAATSREDLRLFGDSARSFAATMGSGEPDVFARAADLGFLSLAAPACIGGLDGDVDALCAVLRPIAREDAGVAAALLVHAGAQQRLRAAGRPWPEAIAATDLLARPAFASGEEEAAALSMQAGRLRGRAALVPLAVLAQRIVVLVREVDGRVAVASCRAGAAGLSRHPVDVLGLHRCAPCDLSLADVEGDVHGVLELAPREDLDASEALGIAAIALGILEGTLAAAQDYAQQRRQGGRMIVEWPEVHRMLATMRDSVVVLDAALAGVWAARRDGDATWCESATALARHATAAARAGTSDGVQVLGGNGYTKDYPQEGRMRDARQLRCMLS